MTTYILDLDDTLYREHDYMLSGLRAVAEHVAKMSRKQRSGAVLYATMRTEFMCNGRANVFEALIARHKLKRTPKELLGVLRNHQPKGVKLYEDAKRLTDAMENILIITDGPEDVAMIKCAALGLDNPLVMSESRKPRPNAFVDMMSWMNLAPRDCTYIGDNPHTDFLAPKKLGMHTIRIVRDYGDWMQTKPPTEAHAPERVVSTLDEVRR